MEKMNKSAKSPVTRSGYWRDAARVCTDTRMLVFAALIVALRVVVKFFKIPLAAGLDLTFDCYVNSVGAVVYGPVMALAVGAVSDTLGCILAPNGAYFLPFILVEMSSGFIFALFLWRRVQAGYHVLRRAAAGGGVCEKPGACDPLGRLPRSRHLAHGLSRSGTSPSHPAGGRQDLRRERLPDEP